uniref:Zinc finger and BTB domain containing 22b n=1 Tax=Sinocyclocheilus rhinocerous TaxID=307959 RepID=A0A673GRN8_9TELE
MQIGTNIKFPFVQASVLDSLNRQREEGHLCDLSIHVQGQVFKAHRCVLAASSPYFHDQVLLKNMSTVSIPAVIDPLAFESVLSCAYTGQLRMLREDIVNYLTVGSVLQMWHIVDKCTELLKEGRGGSSGPQGSGDKESAGQKDDDELLYPRKRDRGGKRKVATSISDQEVGVSDSFGVSSYQDGDSSPPQKRPSYSQPSIMPRKQWVVVKTEGLIDQTSSQHPAENPGQCSSRTVSTRLGSVQSTATRAQLFPLDMQGNQILLYNQAALESTSPLGLAGGMSGVSLKGSLEHGAVHLPSQGALGSGMEGLDGGAAGNSGKVFMCHCGKTFTHKSMRDRHINMHLDLRPFHCPVCAKKFKMKHHLTEHMKTHTGLKPYDCHDCGKKFMWRDSFMRHRSHCERRSRAEGRAGSERTLVFGFKGLWARFTKQGKLALKRNSIKAPMGGEKSAGDLLTRCTLKNTDAPDNT